MRVSLIHDANLPIFNVGLALTIATLRQEGHDVHLVDLMFAPKRDPHGKAIEELKRSNPDVIGISTVKYNHLLDFIGRIRAEFDCVPLVIGGFVPTYFKRALGQILESNVEKVWTFEGQANDEIARFLRDYERGQLPRHSHIASTKSDLNSLPIPDFRLFDMPRYFKENVMGEGYLPLYASMGCEFQCSYCSCRNRPYVRKQPERVLEEVLVQESRHRKHGMRWLGFRDPTFGYHKRHFEEMMGLFCREKVNERLPWYCETRPEVVTKRWAQGAASAGCILVGLGLESSVEQVRRNILNKGYTNKQFAQAIENLREAGIWYFPTLMAGVPGTSFIDDIRSAIFSNSFAPAGVCVSAYYPAEGTSLGDSTLSGMEGLPSVSSSAQVKAFVVKAISLLFQVKGGFVRYGPRYPQKVLDRLLTLRRSSFSIFHPLRYPTFTDYIFSRPNYDLHYEDHMKRMRTLKSAET